MLTDRFQIRLVVAGLCLGLAAGGAQAGYVYVAADAAGANSGASWTDAYTNIQTAVDNSAIDDTIVIKQGTYSVTNQISVTGGTRTIRGGYTGSGTPGSFAADPALTVVQRGTTAAIRILSIANSGGAIEGLTFTGGLVRGDPAQGGGVFITNCTDLVISSCTISNNEVSYEADVNADHGGGGIYAVDSSVLLTNCVVTENRARAASHRTKGAGIYVASGAMTLVDSIIANNRNILLYPGVPRSWGAGVYVAGTVTLRNCLLYGNDGGGLSGAASSRQSGLGEAVYVASGGALTMDFCTVAHHLWSGIYRGGGSAVVSNSIVWANGDDIGGTVTLRYSNIEDGDQDGVDGNISSDPLFDRMYYLQAGSPSVNAGSTNAVAAGTDAKTTRVDGTPDAGMADMGYHYTAGMDMSYANLYVDTGGSDGNSGTQATESLKTITKAITMARDGTHIHVAAGHYTVAHGETFPLTLSGKIGVGILGTNAALTVLDASGSANRVLTLSDLAGARLAHLTMTGGLLSNPPSHDGGGGLAFYSCRGAVLDSCVISNNTADSGTWVHGGGVFVRNSEVTLANCRVETNTIPRGNALGAGVAMTSARLTVRESIIRDNVAVGQYNWNGGGVRISGVLNMRNTLVVGNSAQGVGDGIYMVAGSAENSVLENCTIVANNGQGIRRDAGNLTARNTILWGNGDDVVGTVALRYSNIEDGDQDGVDGNISSDPLFADAAAGDYRLSTGSPSIDTGEYQVWMDEAVDLDGNVRVVNVVDMGAYETPPPPPPGTLILLR